MGKYIFQIFLLLFLLLYLASFAILRKFKRQGREDYYSTDEDEVTVYRISTWLCTFSLAVSIGAVLLLPISIVSNEVLITYPNSYYIKWLNSSLIQGESCLCFCSLCIVLLDCFCYRSLELRVSVFKSILIRPFAVCVFVYWIRRIFRSPQGTHEQSLWDFYRTRATCFCRAGNDIRYFCSNRKGSFRNWNITK